MCCAWALYFESDEEDGVTKEFVVCTDVSVEENEDRNMLIRVADNVESFFYRIHFENKFWFNQQNENEHL